MGGTHNIHVNNAKNINHELTIRLNWIICQFPIHPHQYGQLLASRYIVYVTAYNIGCVTTNCIWSIYGSALTLHQSSTLVIYKYKIALYQPTCVIVQCHLLCINRLVARAHSWVKFMRHIMVRLVCCTSFTHHNQRNFQRRQFWFWLISLIFFLIKIQIGPNCVEVIEIIMQWPLLYMSRCISDDSCAKFGNDMAAANGITVDNFINVYNCWVIHTVPMTYYQAIWQTELPILNIEKYQCHIQQGCN